MDVLSGGPDCLLKGTLLRRPLVLFQLFGSFSGTDIM